VASVYIVAQGTRTRCSNRCGLVPVGFRLHIQPSHRIWRPSVHK